MSFFAGQLEVTINPEQWDGYVNDLPSFSEDIPSEKHPQVRGHWNQRLGAFQKLILIKSFMEEKVKTKQRIKKRNKKIYLLM